MKFLRLAPVLLVGVFWTAPGAAQSVSDPGARLELSGAFISANDLVAALTTHCPGDYGDAPYGADGALVKLHGVVHADEFSALADYVHSEQYAKDQRYIQDKVRGSLGNLRATADAISSCRTLSTTILENYAATKAALQGLR